MEIVGLILMVIGGLVAFGAGIWLLVIAFQESTMWGVGCLLCSPVSWIFVALHWAEAKRPFLIQLAGVAVAMLGSMAGGQSFLEDGGDDEQVAMIEPAQPNPPAKSPQPEAQSELESAMDVTPEAMIAPKPRVQTPPSPVRRSNRVDSASRARSQRRRPRRPSPPPVPAPPVAGTESGAKPAQPPPKPEPEPEPLLLPGHTSPVEIEVKRFSEPDETGLGSLDLRLSNHTTKTVKQLRFTLYYLGKKGDLLKEWKTSLYDPKPALKSAATIEVTQPAFFMPNSTERVAARLDMLGFADGTEWRP